MQTMWDMIWILLVFRPGIISMTNEWQQGKGNYILLVKSSQRIQHFQMEFAIASKKYDLPLQFSPRKTIFQTEAIAFK